MRIGIIGCGNIARYVISSMGADFSVYDINPEKCSNLNAKVCESIDELIENSDLILEAASPRAVEEYALRIVESGKDLVIMSVGGLARREFRETLVAKARERGVGIVIPSGAIGGIDLIKSARIGGIDRVVLRSTKNSRSLGLKMDKRTMVFRGSAEEAIERFPRSVNVAVLLSIASGVEVEVEVYADPEIEENVHEIHVEGSFGIADIIIRNRPSEINPRTSYLAMLSSVSSLKSLENPLILGV